MNIRTLFILGLAGLGIGSAILLATDTNGALRDHPVKQTSANPKLETAVFAGGCFWCLEANFEKFTGVVEAVSGYTGGHVENPTYKQVCAETTGHLESVKVTYDANIVSYEDILQVFWRSFDPTDAGGSFYDRGESYTSAIFVANQQQREIAEKSRADLQLSGRFDKPIVTPVRDLETFYQAEEYHQDYYQKNPVHYWSYRRGSGRDAFIVKAWGKDKDYKPTPKPIVTSGPLDSEAAPPRSWTDQPVANYRKPETKTIRESLTAIQFKVTQKNATEYPFRNDYWDEKRAGIYVDIVSGEPLFSSKDKFKSGTGWPSFVRPLVAGNITEEKDDKLIYTRIEVRSKHADSHLGHVFPDGPAPTGQRYCINSASLRFIPAAELEAQGYGHFAAAFEPKPVKTGSSGTN